MSDKLFGDLASLEDLNELANNLKETNEIDEIRVLAKENNISDEKTEDYISGKRSVLADDEDKKDEKLSDHVKESNIKAETKSNRKFTSGAEKLAFEEKELLKKVATDQREVIQSQFDLVFKELIKRCNENSEFNSLVMQEHKTWERCYKFMENKARKLTAKGASSCAVISTTLFQWIDEYYRLDDKAKYEKEEADKKKSADNRKNTASASKEKTIQKNDTQSVSKEIVEKTIEKTKKVIKKNEPEGQMSLFDFQF